MRTYEVELKRTSYVTLTVVADNEDDAELKAAEEASEAYPGDAHWELESIEEVYP